MNLSNATDIRLGSTTVSAVYYGSTKIWPAGAHDYSRDYLTFEALENTTFTFTDNALQYSLDDGTTWTTLAANTASPTVNAGNKILWKQTGLTPVQYNGPGTFSATGNFNAYGNPMSLYYEGNFANQTDLTGLDYAFTRLFYNNTKIIDVSNLALPATTLSISCYQYMFSGCNSLTTAPELPATTLLKSCYLGMFRNCSSLTTAPELPATTLASNCYRQMFNGCSSLTTAPELPATTLASSCYNDMFDGCSSLTTAPELPATTLFAGCYGSMFRSCSSLATAPELPATTLATYCYQYMFKYCTSLNYIKCLATDISASGCTTDWVNGVASSGTFVKDATMSDWTIGNNGIPTNWVVQNYTPAHDYSRDYLTFEALENTTFTFTDNALQYSLDDGTTWTTLAANTASPTVNAGNKILWKQTGPTIVNGIGTFSSTGNFNAYGNVMSLYYGDNFINQTDLTGKDFVFWNLFYNNTKLISTENLILPATTLSQSCYQYMFFGCTSLTTAPELPATTLANSCYAYMFDDCRSLMTAPKLPATTLANYCYHQMFIGCTSLTTAPELPATTLAEHCYQQMFDHCKSLITAPELPATTLTSYCYYRMFDTCDSLTTAPELPATTLAQGCYQSMFKYCPSLNYIKCLATDISATDCTANWVYVVAASGTFVKAASMSSWTTGDSGIPSGWTVQDAS